MFVGEDVGSELAEILGQEVLGLDEILGAGPLSAVTRVQGNVASLARRVAAARAAGGVVLQPRAPNVAKNQPLPFLNTPVTVTAASPTANLTAQPQRDFRPSRLIIPSFQAQSFVVNSLNIGADPQFVAPGAIGGQFFSEVGVGLELKGTTANLGTLVALNVTNISGVDVPNFAPALLGDSVY